MSDLSVIDRPKNWGGYKLEAMTIEMWKGRENRLHDRLFFEKSKGSWKLMRL
jgi:pyridoxamine 5'-phosphate oxidase